MDEAVPDHGGSPPRSRGVFDGVWLPILAVVLVLSMGAGLWGWRLRHGPVAQQVRPVVAAAPPVALPAAPVVGAAPSVQVVLAAEGVNLDGRWRVDRSTRLEWGDPGGPLAWALHPANAWPADFVPRDHPFLYLSPAPAMPWMQARLQLGGLERSAVSVAWDVRVTYSRTVSRRTIETDSGLLSDTDEDGDGQWTIRWPASACFGGEGELRWRVCDLAGVPLGSGAIPFSIRGENPTRLDVRSALAGPEGFAAVPAGLPDGIDRVRTAFDAIIVHESGGQQFNWDVGRGPTPHQGQDQRGRIKDKAQRIPDDYLQHNPNHSSDGLGLGISQISCSDFDDPVLADMAWNWRSNLAAGARLFDLKASLAVAAIARERRWALLDCGQPVPVPPALYAGRRIGDDPALCDLSPELATAIKYYNGSTSPRQDGVPGDALVARRDTVSRPAFRWDSRRRKWMPALNTAAPTGERGADGISATGDDPMRVNPYVEKVLAEWTP